MSTSIHNPEPVNPDDVLDRYVRTVAAAYRERLAAAYADPATAYAAFRDVANSRGLGDAVSQMRESPAAFGTLLPEGAERAQEAARLGGRAYHARLAQSNPNVAASVLDEAFAEALGQAGGEGAIPRLRGAWEDLSAAYGRERAAEFILRRPVDFAGPDVEPEALRITVELGCARDILRERLGVSPRPEFEQAPPLPLALQDERSAPEPLSEPQQARIVAASAAMRARLATAYQQPLVAEARLHAIINQEGLAGIKTAERDPTLLGELRAQVLDDGSLEPRDLVDSAEFARAGLGYARIAYQYHAARFPDRAAELEAREALEAISRSARDPEQAMEGLQEAIQLHGPALQQHLEQRRADRATGMGNDRGGPGGMDLPDADGDRDGGRSAAPAPAPGRQDDPAVEEALAGLDQQDRALARAERDFKAAADRAYTDPEAAMAAWERLVLTEKGNLDAARTKVAQTPTILGPLRSQPFPQRWGGLAAMVGITNDQQARDAVPRVLDRAVSHTRAQREATNPVSWTTPDGEKIQGRDDVRKAAKGVVADRTEEIKATDAKVAKLGGVSRAEEAAQRTFDTLTPEQRTTAGARLAAKGRKGAEGAALPTGVLGKAMRAARVARDIGEGPAPL
jgi:hypothetical protein